MEYVRGLLFGIAYGIANVIPGLSGGTILVVSGCYDLLCEAFALNIKKIKEHFFFFLLFGLGVLGGLVGFLHAITFLLANHLIPTNLFLMGLILGGVPLVLQLATEDQAFTPACLGPFFLGAGSVIALYLLEQFGGTTSDTAQAVDLWFIAKTVFCAFIAAIAMILPGVSGAFVLLAFGVYDAFLGALRDLDFTIVLPAAAGILLGVIVGSRFILLLMKKSKPMVYSAILGMVLASVVPLFPNGFGLNTPTYVGILCLLLGGGLSLLMRKRESTS